MSTRTLETRTLTYELEVRIEAPPEAVWRALTEETDAWWLADFHVLGEGSTVELDARAGGHLIERREDGTTLLWFTVQMCRPGRSLHLAGHVFPEWGGPATSLLHVSLDDVEGGTALRVVDAQFGHVAESNMESTQAGWLQLFGEGLKRHVES